MPLRDSFCYREKNILQKAERLNLRLEMSPFCGIFFITMPAADPVDLEQLRKGGGAVLFALSGVLLL